MGRSTVFLVASAFVIACDVNLSTPEVFAVVACSHDGTALAPVNDPILVEFNDALVPATADDQSVVLRRTGGDELERDLTVNGLDLVVQPRVPLDDGAEYTLTLDTGLEGTSAGPLPAPVEYTFVTQAQPQPLDVPPFDVVRHGVTMHDVWANEDGALTVGESGLILLSTDSGRFVLQPPSLVQGTEAVCWSVWATGTGTAYVGVQPTAPNEFSYILRIEDGKETVDGGYAGRVHCLHGVSAELVYSAVGDNVEVRDEAALPVGGIDGIWAIAGPRGFELDSRVISVWADDSGIVYAAGTQGIHWAAVDPDAPRLTEWELRHVTPVPCTAVSGLTGTDAVGIALDTTTWLSGNDADMVRREGFAWTDIWWADETWAVEVGLDSDSAESVVFDDPLYDHDGRRRTLQTQELLRAVAAWTTPNGKYALTVGDAGVEFRYDSATDMWTEDTLPKRNAQGEIPGWTDLSGSPEFDDFALYGLRDGNVVQCDLSTPDLPWTVLPAPGDLVPHQLFCTGKDDIWVTGRADGEIDWFVSHYDGTAWTQQWMSSMDVPRDVWAADDGYVFVACDNGVVYRLGGMPVFMVAVVPSQHLYGVWGSSADSVWVCGAKGTISHGERIGPVAWDWTAVPLDAVTNADLNAINGTSENNIVAVGDNGTVLRYDGNIWADLSPPAELEVADVDFTMVWTLHADHIWVASPDHVVLHYDGTNWIKYSTGMPTGSLNAMWGGDTFAGGDLWLAGEDDLLLRRADPPPVLPLIERD